MVLASLLFATMGVGVKIAAGSFNITELVFYRGLVSVVFTAAVLRAHGTPVRTPVPMMHAWRTLVGTLFGILGLMLADPMVAMLKVALERQSLRNEEGT